MRTPQTLTGRAIQTYNRVTTAIAEDKEAYMPHAFAALTQQAKSIVLQSGKFSNAYVRGEFKNMDSEAAAMQLAARAADCVTCKVRRIDFAVAVAFLAEYIDRQRKEEAAPSEASEFDELSHGAKNIVLTVQNSGEIYRAYVEPIHGQLLRKIRRGVVLDARVLAGSSVMRKVIAAGVAEMYADGWLEDNGKVTAADRKQAGAYLAAAWIDMAKEEAKR